MSLQNMCIYDVLLMTLYWSSTSGEQLATVRRSVRQHGRHDRRLGARRTTVSARQRPEDTSLQCRHGADDVAHDVCLPTTCACKNYGDVCVINRPT